MRSADTLRFTRWIATAALVVTGLALPNIIANGDLAALRACSN
jgi:hypothetical protein